MNTYEYHVESTFYNKKDFMYTKQPENICRGNLID